MPAPGAMQTPGAMPVANGHGINHVDIPQPPLITMTAVPGYGPAPLTGWLLRKYGRSRG